MVTLSRSCKDAGGTYLLGRTSFGNRQTDTKDCIGTKFGLIRSAIKLVQESIHGSLIFDINALLNERWPNGLVDMINGFGYPFPSPFGFVTITELVGLVLSYMVSLLGKSNVAFEFTHLWKHPMVQWPGGARCWLQHPLQRWGCHESHRPNEHGFL